MIVSGLREKARDRGASRDRRVARDRRVFRDRRGRQEEEPGGSGSRVVLPSLPMIEQGSCMGQTGQIPEFN